MDLKYTEVNLLLPYIVITDGHCMPRLDKDYACISDDRYIHIYDTDNLY